MAGRRLRDLTSPSEPARFHHNPADDGITANSQRRNSSGLRGFARAEARMAIDARQWRTFRENELNPLTDLRLLDYTKEVDENLICAICRCPFVDHVILECEHAFCRDCLRQTWTGPSPLGPRGNCPTCRTPAKLPSRSNMNRIIANMLDELECQCPKHYQGCTSIVKRAQVDDHVKLYCNYGRVECSAPQCHEPVSRKDSTQDCMHFPVTCIDCHSSMKQSELHEHWCTQCPDRTIECENCKEAITYRELDEHNSRKCLAVNVSCPGLDLGCTVQLRRELAEEHARTCVLAKIAPFMAAQKQKIEEQEAVQLSINRRITILETGFKNFERVLDEHDMIHNEAGADENRIPFLTPQFSIPSAATAGEDLEERTLSGADAAFHPPTFPPWSTDFAGSTNIPQAALERMYARSRETPLHQLMNMHENLREEVTRVTSALSELDGRQSMQMLNDNLRTRDELAYLNGAVAGVSRQVQWLTNAQLQRQGRSGTAEAGSLEYGESAGAGVGVEAAVNAVASAASALRGVARMTAGTAGPSSGAHEMGGRLTRRSTNDENRTKL